jgi:hypothetical protein
MSRIPKTPTIPPPPPRLRLPSRLNPSPDLYVAFLRNYPFFAQTTLPRRINLLRFGSQRIPPYLFGKYIFLGYNDETSLFHMHLYIYNYFNLDGWEYFGLDF